MMQLLDALVCSQDALAESCITEIKYGQCGVESEIRRNTQRGYSCV